MPRIDRKRAIRIRIETLARLAYDHDGAGGLPIRPDVAEFATSGLFTKGEAGASETLLSEVDAANVSLHPDGTITVTLASGGKTLFLDVPCLGIVAYVKAFDDDATSIEGTIRTGYPDLDSLAVAEIDRLIQWLIRE